MGRRTGRRSSSRSRRSPTGAAPHLGDNSAGGRSTHPWDRSGPSGRTDDVADGPISDDLRQADGGEDPTFVMDELGGVTVLIDGFPQSYVHTADPGLIPFEYMQHLALVIDVMPVGKIAVTHVGGAGLSLPRYVEFSRPGSPQIVLEPRAELTERVRAELPLPRGHRIRVRAQTGQEGITALADASADVVVIDAFADGRVPAALANTTFLGHCARVLAPGGLLAYNAPDEPGLAYVSRLVATARSAGLPHAMLIGTHDVLRGRRFGNVIVVAAANPLPEDEIRRRVARADFPTGVRGQDETRRVTATSAPMLEGQEAPSPVPAKPGVWRAV